MASGLFCCCGSPTATTGNNVTGELNVPETETRQAAVPMSIERDLKLEIHDATLHRSFAKIGWMSPYAIITADGEPVATTKSSNHGSLGKSPIWEAAHEFTHGSIPHFITIAVWDKNTFHKDVFCGAVTIPCSPCMGALEHKDFVLTKLQKPTGVVRVSVHTIGEDSPDPAPSTGMQLMRGLSVGGELDHIYSYFSEPNKPRENGAMDSPAVTISFKEVDHPDHNDNHFGDEHRSKSDSKLAVAAGGPAAALMGSWHCVDTHGLDDFLKATGVGLFQRKIANAAAWPSWEFHEKDGAIHFINHSAIGDLVEDIPLDKDYDWKDGHKNDLKCRAEWTSTAEGGTLKITRKGKIGDYSEERTVKGDKLEFVLTHGTGVKWGRSFERH